MSAITKICSKCGEEKVIGGFHKLKNGKYGVRTHCKKCSCQQAREWGLKHKEKMRQQHKQWRLDHPNYKKEWHLKNPNYKHEWYLKNAEKINQKSKQYKLKNPEKVKQWDKQWRLKNKDKIKQQYLKDKENIKLKSKEHYLKNKDNYNQLSKQWKLDNPEKYEQNQKQWRLKNKDKIKQQHKQYRLEHKEERKKYLLEHRDKIKEQAKQWNKQYRLDYKEEINQRKLQHFKQRYKTDVDFRIIQCCRNMVRNVFRCHPKSERTIKYFMCSYEKFKDHIEKQWLTGMTWENRGTGPGKWQIDHIIPCSFFTDYIADPVEQYMCCRYQNLQPLWWEDNMAKSGKMTNIGEKFCA